MTWSPPPLDVPAVVFPPMAGGTGDLWDLLVDLAACLDAPWTLVGGQMVMLHGLQRGRFSPRVSSDIDTAIDVRADPAGLRKAIAAFADLGLEPAGAPSPDGIMHRYVRPGSGAAVDVTVASTSVDVLVPEGLGPSTDITTSAGGRACSAPGTSQALLRTELVPVTYEARAAFVPRPNLLGAIVGKAASTIADPRDTMRHVRDLAFLCSLVEDPFALAAHLTAKDRQRLRAAAAELDHDSLAWQFLTERVEDGRDTWRVLTRVRA